MSRTALGVLVFGLVIALSAAADDAPAKRAFEIADYERTAFVGPPGEDGSLAPHATTDTDTGD